MQPVDLVSLEIDLSSTFWNNPPRAEVWLDENRLFSGLITEPTKINWSGDLPEGDHHIHIKLLDKIGKIETIMEDGKIVKDQLLNIDSISLEGIDLGYLLHKQSRHVTVGGEEFTEMVNLGINGTWSLGFKVPVYIWLLENL